MASFCAIIAKICGFLQFDLHDEGKLWRNHEEKQQESPVLLKVEAVLRIVNLSIRKGIPEENKRRRGHYGL